VVGQDGSGIYIKAGTKVFINKNRFFCIILYKCQRCFLNPQEFKKNKKTAQEMLEDGVSRHKVSLETGISISTLNLLLSKINDYEERVTCEICGERFKMITHKHLAHHGLTFEEYKTRYPNSPTKTEIRSKQYKRYKSPNRGKSFEDIYGEDEGRKKREKISKKQIGRPCPKKAGTGITGTRKDTGMFARSTYEANIDRIFKYNNFKILGEFDKNNPRVNLFKDNKKISYQPDRKDVDGFFEKGAFLEIKGYMYPKDWEKICLFREQNPEKTLLVISPQKKYANICYKKLEKSYKNKIELWETGVQNYKLNPELYNINYVDSEKNKYLIENYRNNINKKINEEHRLFIANKALSFHYSKTKGNKGYVKDVKLLGITDIKKGSSRKSSGVYNYELWKIFFENGEIIYCSNCHKTVDFYCSFENKNEYFFVDNCKFNLKYGKKVK
jgi:hypothetical protein